MRIILTIFAFYVCFGYLSFAEADIKIVRHEISKNEMGKIVKGIIGIKYTNLVTGKEAYVERVFTVGANSDFPTVPTKAELRIKIKEWLTAIQIIGGKSILQNMKDQTNTFIETFTALREGDAQGLIGETINE